MSFLENVAAHAKKLRNIYPIFNVDSVSDDTKMKGWHSIKGKTKKRCCSTPYPL